MIKDIETKEVKRVIKNRKLTEKERRRINWKTNKEERDWRRSWNQRDPDI